MRSMRPGAFAGRDTICTMRGDLDTCLGPATAANPPGVRRARSQARPARTPSPPRATMSNPLAFLAVPLLVLGIAAGCVSDQAESLYVHPSVDWALYQRVAVLPLDNLTTERFAAERVREVLNVELNAQGLFEAVDLGEVNRVVRTQGIVNVSEIGPAEAAGVGKELGVQALLLGSVMEFDERRVGTITTPDIALSLRLLDTETGIVIWAVTDARIGTKLSTRLFGIGEESQSSATVRLVRDILATLE